MTQLVRSATPGQQARGAAIDVSGVSVRYAGPTPGAGRLPVSDVSFGVQPGEFLAILGPSGCGKSTLLKVMAGLLEPSRGTVRIGQGHHNEPDSRVGFVFQSDALLPWRTAVQNVQLAVQLAGEDGAESARRASQLMEELGLGDSCDKYPAQLSGGMRKRVALARALAYQPAVFMMDEPLSALDAQTRIRVGNFLLGILERFGQTVVFVTHDIDEAVALADRIMVMSRAPGRLAAMVEVPLPKPRDYYESRFADDFKDLQKHVWEILRQWA